MMVEWFFSTLNGDCAEWDSERILAAGMNIPQSGTAVFVPRTRIAAVVLLKFGDGWGNETVQ